MLYPSLEFYIVEQSGKIETDIVQNGRFLEVFMCLCLSDLKLMSGM